jgi:YD repeat-containing protein
METLLTVYTLDDKGRVTSTTHPDGSITITQYNGIDKPIRECDALQRCTATQYTARGEVERIDRLHGRPVIAFEIKTGKGMSQSGFNKRRRWIGTSIIQITLKPTRK